MEPGETLLTLGGIVIAALVASEIGGRTPLPRVTLLLLVGIVAGPELLDLLPDDQEQWFPFATNIALMMVGFLLGEEFTGQELRRYGTQVLGVSIGITAATAVAVGLGAGLVTGSIAAALLLGTASTATDPAATMEVTREARSEGSLTHTLRGVVAVDDVWGIVLFSVAIAVAGIVEGSGGATDGLVHGTRELFGALALGGVAGLIMAMLTGRIDPGEPTLLEALGFVFVVAGLALLLEVSLLLTAVVLGTVVANRASHHRRAFHEIEGIETPFLAVFFVLAGASLDFSALAGASLLASAYVVCRIAGRLVGSWLSGTALDSPDAVRRWLGVALLPQAGVALGMALIVRERFPDLAEDILPVVVATTVLFEVIGPPLTRLALSRSGEVQA